MSEHTLNRITQSIIRNDPIIKNIDIRGMKLDDNFFKSFLDALTDNLFISQIVLEKNDLSCESLKGLMLLLTRDTKIRN